MRSIRSFLVIAVLSAITLTNFVAALYGYRASVKSAQTLFDAQLSDTASLIAALLTTQPPQTAQGTGPGFAPSAGQAVFQVWNADRQLMLHSSDAPDTPMAPLAAGFHDRNFAGQRWRVLVRYAPTSGHWIQVAQRADTRYLLADGVVMESVVAVLVSLPIAALFIWLIVGHGLRLLERLAGQLSRKQAGDLSPIALTDPPGEVAVIVAAVNALLYRLNRSFERERRLTADAAHELRTPIAALKVHLHNLARRLPPEDPALTQFHGEVARLEHLIAQILLLYRMEPEHYRANMEILDLTEVARAAIAARYDDFERRGQLIELHGTRHCIHGDHFALTTLIDNLLANANRHTPEGGEIRVTIGATTGTSTGATTGGATIATTDGVRLEVADAGPGMPSSERERVFDRFYRVGGDRNSDGGSGLGLSIVKLIADLHGARVALAQSDLGSSGLAVQIDFPAQLPRTGLSPRTELLPTRSAA